MAVNQAFKHFDSAQCDIRVRSTMILFNAHDISSIRCHPERSRRIFDSLFCKFETLTKRHWITFSKSKNATRGQDAF
ncbi:MAG: hypothetical protein FD170_3632 [Bacteroidetes bacterium]|nr:MAG: hypothetical protein FD170_3632 [Bacteroidota bacterium]